MPTEAGQNALHSLLEQFSHYGTPRNLTLPARMERCFPSSSISRMPLSKWFVTVPALSKNLFNSKIRLNLSPLAQTMINPSKMSLVYPRLARIDISCILTPTILSYSGLLEFGLRCSSIHLCRRHIPVL